MIGSLRGTLLDRSSKGEMLVDVGGVGYRVLVSPATLVSLGPLGGTVLLFTHLHVREDALTLYGFESADARSSFEALLGAHGVGPALAMAILSVHRPDDLRALVAGGDADALCLVPGVGKKTAARLLLELASRLDVDGVEPVLPGTSGPSARSEVREALASLGYAPEEVRSIVADLPVEGDVAVLLKEALSRLAVSR